MASSTETVTGSNVKARLLQFAHAVVYVLLWSLFGLLAGVAGSLIILRTGQSYLFWVGAALMFSIAAAALADIVT